MDRGTRKWLYGVSVAVAAVAVALGWIEEDMSPLLLTVVSSLLAVDAGVATKHVPDDGGPVLDREGDPLDGGK